MREGVKWHNIPPVNGRVTSTERFLAEGFYRTDIGGIIDKFEAPDERHLVWKLKFPYAPIISRIHSDFWACIILPKELNADKALAESTAIGTGDKILDKFQAPVTTEYRKNPEYWGGDRVNQSLTSDSLEEYGSTITDRARDAFSSSRCRRSSLAGHDAAIMSPAK